MAPEVDEEDSEARPSKREMTVISPLLVLKTKTKPFIWKYFGFETDTNDRPRCVNSPKCRLCNVTVATKDFNTSNLYSHLKSKHPDEYFDTWNKQQPLSTSSKEYKALTGAVTHCLTRDMLPLSTVDKPVFRAMLHEFNPRYQLPTRKHFTKVAVLALVFLVDRASAHLVPTWQVRDVLQSIAAALKRLKCMTDALSGENCVMISVVKPLLSHLLEKVLVAEDHETDLTKKIMRLT